MKLIVIPLIVLAILAGIYFRISRKKDQSILAMSTSQPVSIVSSPTEENFPYLTPTEFDVGLIKGKPWRGSNQCNPGILYPLQGLGPEYGSKISDDCPCTQNLKAPDYNKKIRYFK
jgi:hypothetical protein